MVQDCRVTQGVARHERQAAAIRQFVEVILMLKVVKSVIPWIVISLVLAATQSAFACAACSGRSDDAVAQGLNAAILTMLSVLLAVLGTFISTLIYLIRRAGNHSPVLSGAREGTVR